MGQNQLRHPESTRLHFQSLINRIQYRFLDYYHPDDPIRQDILKQVIITELVWLVNLYHEGKGVKEWYLMERLKSGIKLRGRHITQWQQDKMYDLLRTAIDTQRVYQKADVIYEKRSLENGST
jgi:hypothetical protein